MLIIFQLLFSLFSLFTIFKVIKRGQERLLGPKATVFWVLFWLVATMSVWWPNSLTLLANNLGIGRGTDLLLYISLAIIFYLLFKMNVKIEGLNRGLTRVVREKTLDDVDNKNI